MTAFLLAWAPFILPFLLQSWWLSYRFGRIEERILQHEVRLERLERFQDEQSHNLER